MHCRSISGKVDQISLPDLVSPNRSPCAKSPRQTSALANNEVAYWSAIVHESDSARLILSFVVLYDFR
jgi:hypothetical protein